MLRQLYISNIAVIQKATIEFERGLNVFTGETGAGKTILISAIDAVLGERTSKEIIRSGEEKAVVSALFEDILPKAVKKLNELGFEDEDGSVLISREITQSGKSVCKIGGMPATAAILKEVSSLLLNIHGQRDSSQLLQPDRHIELIDLFGDLEAEKEEYTKIYDEMRQIEHDLQKLGMDDAQKRQRVDMLTFQVNEISAAGLSDPNEEEELSERKKIIRNHEKIIGGLRSAYQAIAGDGESVGIDELFGELKDSIATAAEYMQSLSPMSERLEEIGYELDDFSSEIREALEQSDFDPKELDGIESRLDLIYKLKRKYGADISAIIAFGENAQTELDEITTSEERTQKLGSRLDEVKTKAKKLANDLSKKRADAAHKFIKLVENELTFLDMPSVKLGVSQTGKPLAGDGADSIEFLISTNIGEPEKPLSKIASGGETSRIMLAVKNVLASKDDIDTLIFDEIDSGVSGRAAGKIGQKLKQVAKDRQVICVTHLAQVAAFADYHLLIHKQVENGKTYTKVKKLDGQDVAAELARITSGDLVTQASIDSANEMIAQAKALI